MTVHQEAYQLISRMPDESVRHLVELIKSMNPVFPVEMQVESKPVFQSIASWRIGAGKGVIIDPPDFDAWDEEVSELFLGGAT